MTKEEAIDKMEFCKRAYQMMIDENSQEGVFVGKGFEGKWKADTPLYKVYEDMRDACDMAIKALEQEPCEDAISRQATIEAFQMFRGYESNRTNAEWVDRIETVVEKLPPVKQEPCEDAISRTDVLEAISELNSTTFGQVVSRTVRNLPPVNPQAKTWHWIDKDEKSAVCSCCNRNNTLYGDFCKWCGARMVEPQESEEV